MRNLSFKQRMSKTLVILAVAGLVQAVMTAPGWAANTDGYEALISEAAQHSDLVILGRVVGLSMDTHRTRVLFQVDEVFQGDRPKGSMITVNVNRGKIITDPSEPRFTSYDRAFLYLYEDKDDNNGAYRCVNGAFGKKTVKHENVYIHPQNKFLSVKLKDYLEAIRKELQEKEEPNDSV